jgi:hypothetical protein
LHLVVKDRAPEPGQTTGIGTVNLKLGEFTGHASTSLYDASASHHRDRPAISVYEPVTLSKRAGEYALRAMVPELTERSVDLIVVSGDMIEGTTTVMLLERAVPGIVDARREQIGDIPTVEEFAAAVTSAALIPYPTGHTIYVGANALAAASTWAT